MDSSFVEVFSRVISFASLHTASQLAKCNKTLRSSINVDKWFLNNKKSEPASLKKMRREFKLGSRRIIYYSEANYRDKYITYLFILAGKKHYHLRTFNEYYEPQEHTKFKSLHKLVREMNNPNFVQTILH